MKYYYANAVNEPTGPLDFAEICQLAETGLIQEQTPVIAEGSQEWTTYGALRASMGVSAPAEVPPPPAAARRPAGWGLKAALAAVAILIVAAAGVFLWRTHFNRPAKKSVADYVASVMASRNLKLKSITSHSERLTSGDLRVAYSAAFETVAPQYTPVDTRQFLQDQFGYDAAKLAGAQALAKTIDPDDLAAIGAAPADPLSAVVLKSATPAGTAFSYSGALIAKRLDHGWSFAEDKAQNIALPAGEVRGDIQGQTYLADSTKDVAALKTMSGAADTYADKIAQAQPAGLPDGVKTIVKLAKAGVGEDVMLDQARRDHPAYKLTAEQIVYLARAGVPQNVIKALLENPAAPAPASAASAAAPTDESAPTNAASAADAGSLSGGLIAYYPLDHDARDASGNGRDGVLRNGAGFMRGRMGPALHLVGQGFTGANGQYVQLPSIDFSTMSDFSISLWADTQSTTSGDGESFISFGMNFPGHPAVVSIGYEAQHSGGPVHDMAFAAGTAEVDVPFVGWRRWHHYAMVYSHGVMSAYIDGRLVGTGNGTINPISSDAGLGIHWWWNTDVSTRFVGALSDVRIYGRALSGDEVNQLAHRATASGPTAGGMAALRFRLPANRRWFDTGVSVSAGVPIAIVATGTVYVGALNGLAPDNETPAGTPGLDLSGHPFAAPGLPPWSLVGRVGPDGQPFEVGSSSTFAPATDGELYLSVNDDNFGDNHGAWDVTVSGAGQQASAAPAPDSAPAVTEMSVPANVRWVDTGIDLAPGQVVSISANGMAAISTQVALPVNISLFGRKVGIQVTNETPDGTPSASTSNPFHPFLTPDLVAYSLVGRVGDSLPFEVGSKATISSPAGGRLFLSVNANSFDQNAGVWNVTITLASAGN